jgi:hypothetical protein
LILSERNTFHLLWKESRKWRRKEDHLLSLVPHNGGQREQMKRNHHHQEITFTNKSLTGPKGRKRFSLWLPAITTTCTVLSLNQELRVCGNTACMNRIVTEDDFNEQSNLTAWLLVNLSI